MKKWTNTYYENNKDKASAYGKKYYIENRETLLSNSHKYYEEHKDERQKYQNDYYQKNKEKILKNLRKKSKKYFKDVLLGLIKSGKKK